MIGKIAAFLANPSVQADFGITIGKKQGSQKVRGVLRLVFLEIDSPELRGVLFLPDFTIQKGPKTLVLEMKGVKGAKLTLTAPDQIIVDSFMSFVAAFPQFKATLLSQVRDLPIEYEERFGANYVRVTKDLVLQWSQKGQEMSVKMTRRTRARLSPLGKRLGLGIADGEQTHWIPIPEFKSLCTWYCVMLACTERVQGVEPAVKARPPLPKREAPSAVPSMSPPSPKSPPPKPAVAPEPEPEDEPEIEIDVGDIEIETIEPEIEMTPSMSMRDEEPEPEPEAPSVKGGVERMKGRRRLSVNERKMDQVKELVRKMQMELKNQLDAYEPAVVAAENVDEPQLVFPSGPQFQVERVEFVEHELPQKGKMTMDELKSDVARRICDFGCVNYKRYNPKFKYPRINLRDVVYDAKSPESFIAAYEKADPQEAFVLILAVLSNGSIPSAEIVDLFGVSTQDSTQAGLISIVETFGSGVFKKILEIDINWDHYYLPSAMVTDRSLIETLSKIDKDVEKPEQVPEKLPFQMPMNVVRCLEQWFYDTLYQIKLDKLKIKRVISDMSKSLSELFSCYLATGKTLEGLMKELYDSGIIIGAWSVFRAPKDDFETTWLQFWTRSFKEDKLLFNFCDLVKRKQIEKYYAPCAPVRNVPAMRRVAEWLGIFEGLGLSRQFGSSLNF